MSSEGAEAGVENALCHLGGAHEPKLQVTCYESDWLVLFVFLGTFRKFHLSAPATAQLFCRPPIKAPPSAWKGRPVWGEEERVRARSEGEGVSLGLSPFTVRGRGVPSKAGPAPCPALLGLTSAYASMAIGNPMKFGWPQNEELQVITVSDLALKSRHLGTVLVMKHVLKQFANEWENGKHWFLCNKHNSPT